MLTIEKIKGDHILAFLHLGPLSDAKEIAHQIHSFTNAIFRRMRV